MWIKGIVKNVTINGIFIETKNDTIFLPNRMNQNYQLGDCLEAFCTDGRTIQEIRRCEQFVDFKLTKNGKAIVLICNVVDVRWKFEKRWNREVRQIRTDFIEEVLEPPSQRETSHLSDDQLMSSKIVICRVCGDDKIYHWIVVSIFRTHNSLKASDFIKQLNDSDRTQFKGFICTYGVLKNGQDELYIWVPFRNQRDVMLPTCYRKGIARDKFIGKWVTFSMSHPIFLDVDSDVRIIDDVVPTRSRAGRWEIKVPCEFNTNSRNPELYSDVCGTILDPNNVLELNNRVHNLNKDLWVFYQLFEKSRFHVSDDQDFPEKVSSRKTKNEYENIKITRYFDSDKDDISVSSSTSKNQPSTSTSENQGELENVQKALKKLKIKYHYLMDNNLEIPEKLSQDLQSAFKEESRLSKNSDFDESSSEISSYKSERAKSEVDEDELKKHKKLVELFRDMLSSPRVSEEMAKYNPEAYETINQLLFGI